MSEHPRRLPDVTIAPAADGVLAKMPGGSTTTWLNRTAYLVFELCTGENGVTAIAEAVASAFGLDAPPVDDVRASVGELVAAGLVRAGAPETTGGYALDIAAWAPGSMMTTDATSALRRIVADAERAGIAVTVTVDDTRSMRAARNAAANRFVTEGTATHLLLLDGASTAGTAVQAAGIVRLVHCAHDVIGVPVPATTPAWDRIREVARALPDLTASDIAHYGRDYDVSFSTAPDLRHAVDGLLEGRHCNTGALLVRRPAFERMAGAGVSNRHRGVMAGGRVTLSDGWGFFDPGLSTDGIDIDEDMAFCQRVRSSGGRVMIDVTAGFGVCLDVGMRLLAKRP